MSALEVVTGFVSDPSALEALTINTGNSATVRSFDPGLVAWLIGVWATAQTTGLVELSSPQLHDADRGFRAITVAARTAFLWPMGAKQEVVSQQVIRARMIGSSTGGDLEQAAWLIWYQDISGIAANLKTWEEIKDQIEHILTVQQSLALGTSGDYTGEENFETDSSLIKSNRSYAILGGCVNLRCGTIRYRGAFTGNVGLGFPGDPGLSQFTGNFFVRLAQATGLPCIPVFNGSDAGAVLVDGTQDEDGVDVVLSTNLALLDPARA